MSAPKKGVRMHPLLAVLLLLGGLGAAWMALRPAATVTPATGNADDDPSALQDSEQGTEDAGEVWQDLLAQHGSWIEDGELPSAFRAFVMPELAPDTAASAAPAGETASPADWTGEDPPRLRLGVVLISADSRRVVLDGRVVGVGDRIHEAQVEAIERGMVRLKWSGRRLTYDLENDAPREFRSELLRRATARGAGDGDEQSAAPANDKPKSKETGT